jgi:putative ABC transport system permease protein
MLLKKMPRNGPGAMETSQQLIWGLGLVVPTVALLLWLRLDGWGYVVAVGRSLLQLFVFGYLVALVVELRHPLVTWGFAVIMVGVSAVMLRNQWLNHPVPLGKVAFGALLLGVGLATGYGLLLVVQPNPWHGAKVVLPLVGVLVGNAMGGASIAGERLLSRLRYSPSEIEARLCLGATRRQAMLPYRREAITAGFLPSLNSLTLSGLVTMPTLMAGGLLGGMDPMQAAAYALLLLLLSALAVLVTIAVLLGGIERQFFTPTEQLIQW